MIVAKCPACNSNKNKVKYGKFLECLSCGTHFYGVYEEEIEQVTEEAPEEEFDDTPVVEEYQETASTSNVKPKRQVGKPAVKGKVK